MFSCWKNCEADVSANCLAKFGCSETHVDLQALHSRQPLIYFAVTFFWHNRQIITALLEKHCTIFTTGIHPFHSSFLQFSIKQTRTSPRRHHHFRISSAFYMIYCRMNNMYLMLFFFQPLCPVMAMRQIVNKKWMRINCIRSLVLV